MRNKITKKYIVIFLCSLLIVAFAFVFIQKTSNTESKHENVSSIKKVSKPQKISLVGIGDSLTYGEQDPTKNGGYVYLIKKKLQKNYNVDVSTENFGKTGDRTDQIQKRLEDSDEMQKKVAKADVITMTFGGNDLMQVLQNNFNVLLNDQLSTVMSKQEKNYQRKVESLLDTVRKYNPNAPIFVISVYNPFYVYFPTITDLQKYTDEWVDVTKKVVKQNRKMYFVNVNQQLSQGQYLNKDQTELKKQSKLNLEKLSGSQVEKQLENQKEINDYLSDNDHFHPNLKGYQLIADKLYDLMVSHKSTWLNSDTQER
nr:SGNH/GDSL hydrolase family protein [uncultured Ligilactobacillus sp.]